MESKNLKALAVRGTRPMEAADPPPFLAEVDKIEKAIHFQEGVF